MRFETRDPAYFKNILKLIKQFTSVPRLVVAGNTITIKEYDTPKYIYLEMTLQNATSNFRSMFGSRAAPTPTENFKLTIDIEELINAVNTATTQITVTSTTITAGATSTKTYPTFKGDAPSVKLHPTYSGDINLAETFTTIKDIDYSATLEADGNKITITYTNGTEETFTKSISATNAVGEATTKYSFEILKDMLKVLCQLADTAKISYANDEPIKIDATLKYGLGKLSAYIAPIIEKAEAKP